MGRTPSQRLTVSPKRNAKIDIQIMCWVMHMLKLSFWLHHLDYAKSLCVVDTSKME